MKILSSGFGEEGTGGAPVFEGRETVLVVEDNQMMRDFLSRALHMFGYVVLSAEDGEHAMEVISRNGIPVHLVVADIVMPRLDGCGLISELRRWYPAIGVLLMSGYDDGPTRALGVDSERAFFIRKPFSIPAFAAAVRSAIEWRPGHEP